MPGGDRTGPGGEGPRSGRALGYCTGAGMPGSVAAPGGGRRGGRGGCRGWSRAGSWNAADEWAPGAGWRAGGGRGWRNWFHATGLPGWMRGGGAPSVGAAAGSPATWLAERERWLREELHAVQEQRRGMEASGDAAAGGGAERSNQGGAA